MRLRSLIPLLASLMIASPAAAAVPSPANSVLPSCMASCPFGDMPFTVVVRDFANNPIAGSSVVLDFALCPGAFLCSQPFGQPYPYTLNAAARQIQAITNASGSVTIPAHVGGTGPPGSVRVYADGVQLRTYALASPDQNGDGAVVSIVDTDDAIFASKLGTTDPTADFDCSGHVDVADQLTFDAHHSVICDAFVEPTVRSTWGAVKLRYR